MSKVRTGFAVFCVLSLWVSTLHAQTTLFDGPGSAPDSGVWTQSWGNSDDTQINLIPTMDATIWEVRVRRSGNNNQTEWAYGLFFEYDRGKVVSHTGVRLVDGHASTIHSAAWLTSGTLVGPLGQIDHVKVLAIELSINQAATAARIFVRSVHDSIEGASLSLADGLFAATGQTECKAQNSAACCRPDAAAAAMAATLSIAGLSLCEIVKKMAAAGFGSCVIAAAMGLTQDAVDGILQGPQCVSAGGGGGGGSAPPAAPPPNWSDRDP